MQFKLKEKPVLVKARKILSDQPVALLLYIRVQLSLVMITASPIFENLLQVKMG